MGDLPDFIEPDDREALRRELAGVPDVVPVTRPAMTRDEAILRLAGELPEGAFASLHLTEVALVNANQAEDLRAGRAARFSREWTVQVVAPGYAHAHSGDELGPVVEQALAEYLAWRRVREAEEWARTAVPDKPPKLLAPGTADERHDQSRGRDAG